MNPEQLHVLLIGIDAYDGDGSLQGCVNDVDAIQGILLDRLKVPTHHITRLVSPRFGTAHDTRIIDQTPTMAAITAELDRLAGDEVGQADRVFIYYSGHGTQLLLEDDEGNRFPREALLPKDKGYGPTTRYLADWQLNAAMARIGANCRSATIVLDCCSSAGATRSPSFDTGKVRFWPTPEILRLPVGEPGVEADTRGVTDGLLVCNDNCQVVAACQADEKAKEADLDGRVMGHLSRSLCEQLMSVDAKDLPGLRWGEIWRQVEAAVLERNSQQRPWLSSSFGRAVFGGDPSDHGDTGFAVRLRGNVYQLNVGTLAGVTEGAGIAVYGPEPAVFPPLGSAADQAARKGELRITLADRASSVGVHRGTLNLPGAARGRLAAPGVDAKLSVLLQPHDEPAAVVLRESPFLLFTDDPRHADLELLGRDEGWFLADDLYGADPERPRLPAVPHARPDILRAVVEHYYHYRAPLRLAHACRDLPTLLRILLLDCNRGRLTPQEAQTAALPEVGGTGSVRYAVRPGDNVCIAVHNRSEHNLYVTLLNSAATGRVELLGVGEVPAHGRERFWAGNQIGRPFPVSLPQDQPMGVDRLVAIGTTAAGTQLDHLQLTTRFADLVRLTRDSVTSRDLLPQTAAPPAEQYTSATADLWIGCEE